MAGIEIDRMIVRAPGLSTEQGRQLGLRIAALLADAGGFPATGNIPKLEVRAPAEDDADIPDLAQRIVDQVLRELRRGT